MALAGVLCQTLLAATGFTSKNLRVLTAGLLGTAYTPGQNPTRLKLDVNAGKPATKVARPFPASGNAPRGPSVAP